MLEMQPSPKIPRLESPEHLGSWFLVPGAGLHSTQIFKCDVNAGLVSADKRI